MSSNGSIIMGEYKFIPKSNSKWDVKKATPGTKMYVAKVVSNGNKNKLIELIEAQGHSIEGINISLLNKKNNSPNAQAVAAHTAEARRRFNQSQASAQAANQANTAKRAANAAAQVAATKNVAQNIGSSNTRLTRTSSFSGLSSFLSPKPKSANSTASSTVKPVSRGFFSSTASVAKSAAKLSLANIQAKLAQSHENKIKYENKIRNKTAKQDELTAKITSLETALTALRLQIKNHNVTKNKAELNQLTEFITSTETKLASIFSP